ncbi:MAG: TRAP transporter large permease subunit [Dehalococcoidia bacterium]|nr:TRAP transporter large permease subunit [Dehalococcoidia bacterium]
MLPIVALVALVLGVIYSGLATLSEAAAFGVSGAFVLTVLLNSNEVLTPLLGGVLRRTGLILLFTSSTRTTLREARMPSRQMVEAVVRRNVRIVMDSVISTVRTTGMIFLILLAALTLSFAFARLGISQQAAELISGLALTDWQLVLALVLFYLVLGTFMESFAMMVTTVPVLLPALQQAGVDLVWFGVIVVLLVEAALISPPEGINLYVLHGVRRDVDREQAERANEPVRETTIKDVWIGVLPFMACMAATTVLVLAVPQIALWLPDLIYGLR